MENFEFKSAICTSVEQSKRLLDLGLKKETADCGHCSYGGTYIVPKYPNIHNWDNDIPAWSLHRLMEMYGNNYNYFCFQNAYNELIHAISISIEDGSFNKDYLEERVWQ